MIDKETILSELIFKTARSSGSGGQHVNKVSTKVELYFNIAASQALSEMEKSKLLNTLSNRVNKDETLILSCDETRSQISNKTIVIKRLFELLEANLKPKKKRKPTHVPSAVKRKRLESKRKHAEKKANRKPPDISK